MTFFAMVLYGVTRIAAPFGFLTPLQDYRATVSGFALSRDGSVGIILRRKGTIDPDWRCLVIARNGRRRLLPRPPSSLLAVPLTENPDTFPPSYLSYDELAFADDGTLFLTTRLATGMHGLWTAGIVSWNGSVWRNPVPSKPIPGYTGNDVELVAATSSERFVATEDFNDSVLNLDRFSDPHYEEVKSLIVDGRNIVSLGYGFATAMKGGFVVGYSYGARDREYPDGTIRPSTALMWQDGWRTTLGPGVARGVDARGDAVGDDDATTATGRGRPTLWRHGRAIRLSDASGSAMAISDDGTIVGTIESGAFAASASDPTGSLLHLDEHLVDRSWHVDGAYAIAESGRILAVGSRKNGPKQLLILDPLFRKRPAGSDLGTHRGTHSIVHPISDNASDFR